MFELAEPDALSSVNKAATREVLDGSAQAAVKKRTGVCQICRHATGVGMGTNWEQTGSKLGTSFSPILWNSASRVSWATTRNGHQDKAARK